MTARIFSVLMGTWLFCSAFMWPHQPLAGAITMVAGLAVALFGVLTIFFGAVRYASAVVAVVLFAGTIAVARSSSPTLWHNCVIAIAVFVAGMLAGGPHAVREERALYGRT